MKKYDKPGIIRRILRKLKTATRPGQSVDGQMIQVRYEAARKPTDRALEESGTARRQGLDLRVFTGHLDRVWKAKTGGLCFTMLAFERIALKFENEEPKIITAHCYRTINTNLGRVRWLKVL